MYRIEVNINELYLRLGQINKKDQKDEIYLYFEWKYKNKWTRLNEKIKFYGHLQRIDVGHVVYVKKYDVMNKELNYRVLLEIEGGPYGKEVLKYVGSCVIYIKDYDIQKRDLPFGVSQPFQLSNCPDKQAYLKFTIRFEYLMDFRLVISQSNLPTQSYSLTRNDMLLQYQKQISSQILQYAYKIYSKNKRLSDHIKHLKNENYYLVRYLKQKQHSIRLDKQLKYDKLDMLIKRKLKASYAYKKVKEKIANVYNVINYYGQPDLIEDITNILIKNHSSYID